MDTTGWFTVVTDSPRVEFRLPPGFARQQYDISLGNRRPDPHQEWDRAPFETFFIQESAGPDSLTRATPRPQRSAEDYSECLERVNGTRVVIQALRSGTMIDEGKRSKTFDVNATFERRPGLYVRIFASAASRAVQEQLLAVVRTVLLR